MDIVIKIIKLKAIIIYIIFCSVLVIVLSGCKEKSKSNLKTVSITSKLDSIIIGTWIHSTSGGGSDSYDFYENQIWRNTNYNYKGDTTIIKGKYLISKDSAIFLRRFGSVHWPNKDTINDYKTSMWSEVLFFINNNTIRNNQEDYDVNYTKIRAKN